MNLYHTAIELLRIFALVVGILIIFAGITRGAVEARGAGGRDLAARRITEGAALGLEFFIGATILNLILNPTWPAVATTALTILVRELLTFSLGASSPARRSG